MNSTTFSKCANVLFLILNTTEQSKQGYERFLIRAGDNTPFEVYLKPERTSSELGFATVDMKKWKNPKITISRWNEKWEVVKEFNYPKDFNAI